MGIHPKIGITGLPRSGKSAVMQKVVSMLSDERVEEMRARGDDVEAAKLRGEGLGWVMRREILPNIMPPLIAEFGLRFCFVFLTIAAL